MTHSYADDGPGIGSVRERSSIPMPTYSSPATEVLIVADCWSAEADADAVIHRAIEAAAAMVDTDTADAELAIMLTPTMPASAR